MDNSPSMKFWYERDANHKPTATFCRICVGADKEYFYGTAVCHTSDQFCRETGRKLALTRAIKSANLSYLQRRALWNNYWHMTGKRERYSYRRGR